MEDNNTIIEANGREINCSFPIKYGLIQSNMWNLDEMDGYLNISKIQDSLNFNVKIDKAKPKKRTIFGYPEICVGNNLMGQRFNERSDINGKFPSNLKDLLERDVRLLTNFSIDQFAPLTLPFNISYDFWIRRELKLRMPDQDEYEIMIWMHKNKQKPIGEKKNSITIPCKIEGEYQEFNFDVWYGSAAQWKTITFTTEEDNPFVGMRTEISINEFFRESMKHMGRERKDYDELYLMGLELGSEFGDPDKIIAELIWTLKEYKLIYEKETLNLLEF